MKQPLLLDTCALMWSVDPDPKGNRARTILAEARATGKAVHVSAISAQEMGMQVRKKRLKLAMPLRRWFAEVLGQPGVYLADVSLDVLIAANELPELHLPDPFDRIMIATARERGLCLVTRDRLILSYAAQGHVLAVAC